MIIWCTAGCAFSKDGLCDYGGVIDIMVNGKRACCMQFEATGKPTLAERKRHRRQIDDWKSRGKGRTCGSEKALQPLMWPLPSITPDSTVAELLATKETASGQG